MGLFCWKLAIGKSKTMFVKGQSGNPAGMKKGYRREISLSALKEALAIVEAETIDVDGKKKKRVPILVHAWRRAYESDAVLSILIKKFIPDAMPVTDEDNEKLINQELTFEDIPQNGDGQHRFAGFLHK
jgi:hypothetical protein